MRRARISPVLVLGTIALALIAWGLYESIESYDEKVQSPWSAEAIRNPFLAAQQFMSSSGIDVVEADSLVKLDSLAGVGTLFISDANQVLIPRELDRVLQWLESGGNVIFTANSVEHADDLLLAEFGVEVDWYDNRDPESAEKPLSEIIREYNREIESGKSREDIARRFNADASLTLVEFAGDIGDLEIAFNDDKVLRHPYIDGSVKKTNPPKPRSWSYSDNGNHLMQFDVGDGLLTIISDPSVWTSHRIDQYDHAFLLWVLSAKDGAFAILRPVLQDSLWTLAAERATELLLATGLLIAFWIWHLGYRFGRIVPRDISRTRALGEYFSSVTHYLWHRRHGAYLVAPLRQRVLRRASLVLAEFSHADPPRQMELIAARCGMTSDRVSQVMAAKDFNETGFVQTVKILKHIEQSL